MLAPTANPKPQAHRRASRPSQRWHQHPIPSPEVDPYISAHPHARRSCLERRLRTRAPFRTRALCTRIWQACEQGPFRNNTSANLQHAHTRQADNAYGKRARRRGSIAFGRCTKPTQVYSTERCTEHCTKHCARAFWCLVLDYDHCRNFCKKGFGVWSWMTATGCHSAKGFWCLALDYRNFHDFCRGAAGLVAGAVTLRKGFGAWPWTTAISMISAEGLPALWRALSRCEGVLVLGPGLPQFP